MPKRWSVKELKTLYSDSPPKKKYMLMLPDNCGHSWPHETESCSNKAMRDI